MSRRTKIFTRTAQAIDKITPKFAILRKIAPVPDLEKMDRFLLIGPHPDDLEIGMGATIAKLVKAGKTVKMVICTDGGSGSDDATLTTADIAARRAEETKKACAVLGVTQYKILDFPDGGVYSLEDMSCALAKEIYDFAPNVLFCPDPHLPTETHPDHLGAAKAAVSACTIASNYFSAQRHGLSFEVDKLVKGVTIAYYYTHRANCFVAVSQQNCDVRTAALECHESQFKPLERDGVLTYLSLRLQDMGERGGVALAEGFFAMHPMHQHCVTELNDPRF